MSENRGSWLSTATGLFFSWAALSLGVRIWVKLGRNQNRGLDDYAILAAFVLVVLHVAANFWAIHYGYGLPLDSISDSHLGDVEGALYTSQLSYIIATGLTKISTAFFIGRLTRYAPQVRMSYILAGVTGVWVLASTLVIALRGDLGRPWATLDGSETLYHRWLAVEAIGLAIEVALWALSIFLIWNLQMRLRKRVMILAAFGCRLFLIPLIALRLVYLSPAKNENPTVTSIIPHILTEAALEYSVLCTSITALKPFLRPLHSSAIVNSVGGNASNPYSRSQGRVQGIYMLSSVSGKDNKDEYETTTTAVESTKDNKVQAPKPIFRPEISGGETVTSVQTDMPRDDIESLESGSSEQMIIRTTRNWSVRYEER
ncbi:uncharacterized protein A1O5_10715 [Cladophialophora psammophila CBS 110553]|uniref:Rhodopsin domain-containing protein n=1 Tax=Cladophialophora psammophila CBS 110553 TaxID=1182543 RepID=W9WM69_9EURO|nr:uncharacterized protein A1O5_10715 [Cladophialophora psammophila CBS 110553]EXJ66100.1 hypothetical protein A1O5_10715 [Cladophialophora psammophila CBS 110553]